MPTTTKTHPQSYKYGTSGRHSPGSSFNTGGIVRYDDVISGTDNPSYRDQIRNVTSATTPASGVKRKVKVQAASGGDDWQVSQNPPPPWDPDWYHAWLKIQSFIPRVDVGGNPVTSGGDVQSADNQAIAALYDKLSSIESSAQAGEDLGEIKQTIRGLTNPMAGVRDMLVRVTGKHGDYLRRYRSNPSRERIATAKALADAALEYKFGITPTINTIAGLTVGLQNREYMGHYVPFKVNGKTSGAQETQESHEGVGNRTVKVVRKVTSEQIVRYKGVWGVEAGIASRSVADVASLRWRDVVPTIWNLIPYSFLVDYFTNIGTIVSGLSVPYGGVRWCVKTVRNTVTQTATAVKLDPIEPYFKGNASFSPGFTQLTETAFQRSDQGSIPRPSLEFNLPTGKQWVNIGLLVVSQLAGIRPLIPSRGSSAGNALQGAFATEVGRRGLRVPYPFHS